MPRRRSRAQRAAHEACQVPSSDLLRMAIGEDDCTAPVCIKGAEYHLVVISAKQLTRALEEEIMTLLTANMQPFYDASESGWNPRTKLREMREAPSRLLIARDACNGHIAAYALFRADADECDAQDALKADGEDDIELIYCYEMQVAASHRGRGLGNYLMACLERIAKGLNMRRVMLTVFNHNTDALAFYGTQGFKPDLISPPLSETGEYIEEYQILSKVPIAR